MYVVDEGKSRVLEIGVYLLETLGSVGLPAEQATQALLRMAGPREDGGRARAHANPADDEGDSENVLDARRNTRVEKLKSSASGKQQLKRRKRRPRSADAAASARRQRRERERERACSALQRRSAAAGGLDAGHNNNVLQRALRFVIEAKRSTPQQIISRILFYLADALKDSLDCEHAQRDLQEKVDRFAVDAHAARGDPVRLARVLRPLSHSITGVVLSYQERDDLQLPSAALHRLRRGMHFDIPVRPFDATVELLPAPGSRRGCALRIDVRAADADQLPHMLERQSSHLQALQDAHAQQQARAGGLRRPRSEGSPTAESDDARDTRVNALARLLEEQDARSRREALAATVPASKGRQAAQHEQQQQQLVQREQDQQWPPCTPQSFPPTPHSRSQLLDDYSAFTENVLWRARDELRVNLDKNARSRLAIFNPDDAHPKLTLSCGGHCAALARLPPADAADVAWSEAEETQQQQHAGQGAAERAAHCRPQHAPPADIYRSVRAALPLQLGRATYFEVSPLLAVGARDAQHDMAHDMTTCGADADDDAPLQLCVGVASRRMPLRNAFPGLGPASAGLDASGVLMCAPHRSRAPGFGAGSLVGVLVRVYAGSAHVSFLVDGVPVSAAGVAAAAPYTVALRCGSGTSSGSNGSTAGASATTTVSADEELFPAVSVRSRGVKVFGHFSAADMRHPDAGDAYWDAVAALAPPGEPVYALDGTLLVRPKAMQM